jgi:hypothetical protein
MISCVKRKDREVNQDARSKLIEQTEQDVVGMWLSDKHHHSVEAVEDRCEGSEDR